jgi:DNA-binding CsgD family transcriptional regulator
MVAPKNEQESISITKREKEILRWLRQGKSSWEISKILGISERTVNFHVYNIMGKLGAVNRLQAVAIALQMGLLDFD